MPTFGTTILGLIGSVAPTIATALGGPLAGLAVRAICGAIGLPDDARPEAISTALAQATPDQLLALKQADNAFAAQMKQLDVDFAKVSAGDAASARQREVSVHDRTPAILAGTLTTGFLGLLTLIVFYTIPLANAGSLNILFGALATGWVQSINYYFGSSFGSKAKSAMLFQSVPADPQQPAAPAGRSPSPVSGSGAEASNGAF